LTVDFPAEHEHAGNTPGPLCPALAQIEAKATSSFFSGDAQAAVEAAQALVALLSASNGDSSRRELLGKHLAVAHVQMAALEALLGTVIAKKNAAGVELVTRALREVAGRFVRLSEAHAAESGRTRRPVVVVGHADNVTVTGGHTP
jgi:hypothetical protein